MTVYISAKQLKKRGDQVASLPYTLTRAPETLRQLIEMLVRDGVDSYNRRIREKTDCPVLTRERMEELSEIGKIAFGIPFSSREADLSAALETAYQGFSDGLYRVFLGDGEIEALDTPLTIREGDTITLIRLVMLTGGWF